MLLLKRDATVGWMMLQALGVWNRSLGCLSLGFKGPYKSVRSITHWSNFQSHFYISPFLVTILFGLFITPYYYY